MRILFCHQNFPGQFLHIAEHLASVAGDQVVSISQPQAKGLAQVPNMVYKPARSITKNTHHYIAGLESAVLNGQATAKVMEALKQKALRQSSNWACRLGRDFVCNRCISQHKTH